MPIIRVLGSASGREIGSWEVPPEMKSSLMDFLRAKGVPIASSCAGDGVCRKCVVNGDVLSCQLSVARLPLAEGSDVFEVTVTYL